MSPNGGSSFLGNSTANVYNSNGTISKSYDLANHETDYTYSSSGYSDGTCSNLAFPTQIKNVTTGLTTSYTWDCTGGVKLTAKDPSGNTTSDGLAQDSSMFGEPDLKRRPKRKAFLCCGTEAA